MTRATSTQEQAAATLLELNDKIEIGGRHYEIGKPTLGTIIMVSALVQQLPAYPRMTDAGGVIHAVMRHAKDEQVMGRIIACLILGAKRIKQGRTVTLPASRRSLWRPSTWLSRKPRGATVNEYDYLSTQVIDEMSVEQAVDLISTRLGKLNLSGFFALTTSLKTEGDILKPTTGEVESARTTQPGRSC